MLLEAKGCCGESCFLSPSPGCVPLLPNRTRGQAVPAVLSWGSVHLPSSWPALLPSCLCNSLANSSKSWLSFCSAMARSPKWEFYQGFNEMFPLYKYALLSNLPLNLVVFTKSGLTWRQRYHSPFTKHSLGATCSGMLGRQSSDNRKTLLPGSSQAGRDSKTKTKRGGYQAGKQGLARPQRRELLLQWGLCTPSTCPWGPVRCQDWGNPRNKPDMSLLSRSLQSRKKTN